MHYLSRCMSNCESTYHQLFFSAEVGIRLKGKSSRWFGYLQSLPKDIVDLPVFWTYDASSRDGREGIDWLRGTEVERQLQRTSETSLENIVGPITEFPEKRRFNGLNRPITTTSLPTRA